MTIPATESARIADELQRSLTGPAWHGDSLLELLEGVSDETAGSRSIPAAHTIEEIVLHLASMLQMSREALRGEPMPQEGDPRDWPLASGGDEGWKNAREALRSHGANLIAAVEKLSDDRLEEVVPGRAYNIRFLLHGLAQHAAYHGGQIAIIRKSAEL